MNEELEITPEFISGLKEFGRTVVFTVASFGVSFLPELLKFDLTPEQRLVVTGIFIPVFSALSEWIHKLGVKQEKLTNEASPLTTGLSRF